MATAHTTSFSSPAPGAGAGKLSRLSRAEQVAIAASVVVFSAALFAYVTEYPILKSLIQAGTQEAVVGKIQSLDGTIRRQSVGAPGFREIPAGEVVYNRDAIATDGSSSGRIDLGEGGVIELGPNSLVRLDFESRFSLSGISRTVRVEAIRGTVSGEAGPRAIEIHAKKKVIRVEPAKKKRVETRRTELVEVAADVPMPKPIKTAAPVPVVTAAPAPPVPVVTSAPIPEVTAPPIPEVTTTPVVAATPSAKPSIAPKIAAAPPPAPMPEIALVEPAAGAQAVLNLKTLAKGAQVRFRWSWNGPRDANSLARISVRAEGVLVLERELPAATDNLEWWAPKPGIYEWSVTPVQPAQAQPKARAPKVSSRTFRVPRDILAISPLPLGYDLTNPVEPVAILTWEAVAAAESYRVLVEDAHKPGVVVWKQEGLKKATLRISMNAVPSERWRYRVQAEMPGGFRVLSKDGSIDFADRPIALGEPAQKARITEANLLRWDGHVLFTWQKALGAGTYRLEVSTDEKFRKLVVDEKIKANFASILLEEGEYWWRVTPIGQTQRQSGGPYQFSIGGDEE